MAGRQAIAHALPRHSESFGHVALVAQLPVRRDGLPLLLGARPDERVDEAAQGAEQHVTGLAGAEVAAEAVVTHGELQGAPGDGVDVAPGGRRVAHVLHRADAHADAQVAAAPGSRGAR